VSVPSYPGVYVEEIPWGVHTIEGVPTSTAAFVGETRDGPRNEPVAIASVDEYRKAFADHDVEGDLGSAVGLFFANGGTDAIVVRTDEPLEGLAALERPVPPLLCLPGISDPGILEHGLAWCEANGAFCIIDPPGEPGPDGFPSLPASPNGAVYHPRLRLPGRPKLGAVGPAGAVAGVFARTDGQRGVWKTPAGTEAVLHGVESLDRDLDDDRIAALASHGVNTLRTLPGVGPVVWGARTLAADPEWKYVSVRRTALYLEHSLEEGLRWAVFEPNDEPLWARVRATVDTFLHAEFRRGAFQGATPAEAYFLRCDPTSMTQDDVDQGRLVVLVGFAPLKPAEFVIIRIGLRVGRPRGRVAGRAPAAQRGSNEVQVLVEESQGWTRWTEVASFEHSGPQDRVFAVDAATGQIRFGDGKHGRRPEPGLQNVQATYRVGGGKAGKARRSDRDRAE
jgi:hypothetical protein